MQSLKLPSFTGSTLKIIAIVTMLIDHTAAAVIRPLRLVLPEHMTEAREFLLWVYPHMRSIGRLAFPIFCFLLVEGFFHTRNAARYARRLFVFALISELPFDFALANDLFARHHQNVYFTLLFGLFAMMGLSFCDRLPKETSWQRIFSCLLAMAAAAAPLYAAKLLYTDYGFKGVLLIEVLYCYRSHPSLQAVMGALAISWERIAPLSFIPIRLYNGKRGISLKYFFYWFYPAHLILLGFLKMWLLSLS